VTCRSNNKVFFPLPLEEVWLIMLKELHREVKERKLAIHAFVLMGNHIHMLCHTPEGNLSAIMMNFLRRTSLKINYREQGLNHLWGERYKWSLIESHMHYCHVYRYLYQNPLRAKICERVEDYPYSTLQDTSLSLCPNLENDLEWLNEKYQDNDQKLIRTGLRRSFFDVNKRKSNAMKKLSLPIKHQSERSVTPFE
jgi:putative transposase